MTNHTISSIVSVHPVDAEALKPDPSRRRAKSIIQEFSLNTSTHGIPGIGRSQSIQNRLFWTIALLTFTGVMVYFITQAIIAFFQYPTQTLVSVEDEDINQTFPAVSFCNYSPIRYDRFIEDFLNYTNSKNLTNKTSSSSFTVDQSLYIEEYLRYKLNANESLSHYFFDLNDMLLGCTYNSVPCTKDEFVSFLSPEYGNCFTFNAKTNYIRGGENRLVTENGEWGDLKLNIYIHSHLYIPYFSTASGIVAMIHDNEQMPLIGSRGQYFMPGRQHRLLFSRKTHFRLGPPYSECDKTVPFMLQVAFEHFGNASYGYEEYVCGMICEQTYIFIRCGCINPFEWTARYIVLPGTNTIQLAPLCHPDNRCYREIAHEMQLNPDIWLHYCKDCDRECETRDFISKASSLLAPMPWLLDSLKELVENRSIPLPKNWSETWKAEISQNYLALEVVVETGRIEKYNEIASMSPVDLLSNVGGQTGLWIGISFLSLMELVEMLYRLLRYQFYKLRARIQPNRNN